MARPSAVILNQATDEQDKIWCVLATPDIYLITYQGRPCQLRTLYLGSLTASARNKKYLRMTLNNKLSVERAVRRFNKLFNTTEFSYIKIGDNNETQ